jgi:hypothetical protein
MNEVVVTLHYALNCIYTETISLVSSLCLPDYETFLLALCETFLLIFWKSVSPNSRPGFVQPETKYPFSDQIVKYVYT